MPDINDNDIDALLTLLAKFGWERYHATAKALVAERDALRIELTNAKSFWRPLDERRNTEQRQESDRDLRERLVCAIWPEIMREWREHQDAGEWRGWARHDALEEADAMLAAMRKGEA